MELHYDAVKCGMQFEKYKAVKINRSDLVSSAKQLTEAVQDESDGKQFTEEFFVLSIYTPSLKTWQTVSSIHVSLCFYFYCRTADEHR